VSFEKLLNQILGQRGMLKSGKRQPSKEKGAVGLDADGDINGTGASSVA